MRISVFGANGPTGRLLTQQSLDARHRPVVLTRHPDTFPLRGDGVRVVGGDVLDQAAVDDIVKGSNAVVSVLGVPFGKAPIEVYSRGVGHILDAMKRYEVSRLVVVSSSAVTGDPVPGAGFFFNRVLQPYVTRRLGRTTYDDLRRMEALVSASDVDWTILRPSGLFDQPAVTSYSLTEAHGPGRFTARTDLADALLRQLDDDRFVRKVGYVVTTEGNPSLLSLIVHEALKKQSENESQLSRRGPRRTSGSSSRNERGDQATRRSEAASSACSPAPCLRPSNSISTTAGSAASGSG